MTEEDSFESALSHSLCEIFKRSTFTSEAKEEFRKRKQILKSYNIIIKQRNRESRKEKEKKKEGKIERDILELDCRGEEMKKERKKKKERERLKKIDRKRKKERKTYRRKERDRE